MSGVDKGRLLRRSEASWVRPFRFPSSKLRSIGMLTQDDPCWEFWSLRLIKSPSCACEELLTVLSV